MDSENVFDFYKKITKNTLCAYLSRAVTHAGLLASAAENPTYVFEEDLRMLKNIGAKFIGRAAYIWNKTENDDEHFKKVQERAKRVHEVDPDIILQAGIFETAFKSFEQIPIPKWAFEEFNLQVEDRNFEYDKMIFKERFNDRWEIGGSVPDMTRIETKMWFYYRARRYIDAGIEAIHFGQVHLMDADDSKHKNWFEILKRIRKYASANARRKVVLCDAHTKGVVEDGKLLFDFHSFPIRLKENVLEPKNVILEKDYLDSIFGKSRGGLTPSNWETDSLPYLVEIDNFGLSEHVGEANLNDCYVWGYDEITWFARKSANERDEFLKYAQKWIDENCKFCYLQMPTRRVLAVGVFLHYDLKKGILHYDKLMEFAANENIQIEMGVRPGEIELKVKHYKANTQGLDAPNGFSQEETIKKIWGKE